MQLRSKELQKIFKQGDNLFGNFLSGKVTEEETTDLLEQLLRSLPISQRRIRASLLVLAKWGQVKEPTLMDPNSCAGCLGEILEWWFCTSKFFGIHDFSTPSCPVAEFCNELALQGTGDWLAFPTASDIKRLKKDIREQEKDLFG